MSDKNAVKKTITQGGMFTPWVKRAGQFVVGAAATSPQWDANVRVQRSIDDGATFDVVYTFTGASLPTVVIDEPGTEAVYRIGCPEGDHVSGQIPVRIE